MVSIMPGDFKIVIINKCLNSKAPKYISDRTRVKYQPTKTLRIENNIFHLIPNLKRTERSFKHCNPGPEVWNKIPNELGICSEVKMFKQKTQAILFTESFDYS